MADGRRPALPAARHADRPARRHRRAPRGPAAATRTRPGRRPVREQEHRGRRLPGAAGRGHGGEPPGRRHPHRPAPHHPGRGAPGQRLLRGPAGELGARRGPHPGRGGLRAAGGGGADRPPGGRHRPGDRHQRVLPARLARPARRDRRPPDRTPRAARRPGRGDRDDRRPAGPRPAHPLRGAARPAGRRGGSDLPRRPRRAVPGRRPGDRDPGRRRPGPGPARARGAHAPPGDGLPDPHPPQPDGPGHAGRAPPPHGPARGGVPGHPVRGRHDAGRTAARRQPAPVPAGRARPPAAEPGQRRLTVQALLGRPADRLGPGRPGPDRPGGRGQGRGRPGQLRLPAGDHGRAAGRRARRHRQMAPGVAAGQARRAGRSVADAPARVDLAGTGRRPHPLDTPSGTGRQRRVRPGRAQAWGRRGSRPAAERRGRRGRRRGRPGERVPAPGVHPAAGRPGQVRRGPGPGQRHALTPGRSRSARSA